MSTRNKQEFVNVSASCIHERHLEKMSTSEKWLRIQAWTSLLVQQLRICPPMQGHGFDPWSGKIPHAVGAPGPTPCNSQSPQAPKLMLHKSGPHAATREEPLFTATRESPCGNEDLTQPKIN